MRIAVEGCCHGELDKIYERIAFLERQNQYKVDLLICCGDFQAVRNPSDLNCMAVPDKFKSMGSFYKYYSGERKAPILTIFIGGNHEASNYLQELPYGGWAAPNIYFLGYAGVLNFNGVRIGGISGIYKDRDYNRGHHERLPYSGDTMRSVYHVRNVEVFRMKQLKQPLDIFLSHDWPVGVYNHGNIGQLLRWKPFFRDEVESNQLGSPAAAELLRVLKPNHWFSAHLHVKFEASVPHREQNSGQVIKCTKFLALDKCLPKRQYLEVIELADREKKTGKLELDAEWLAVLKSTNHLWSYKPGNQYMPGLGCSERYDFTATEEEIDEIRELFGDFYEIPDNFEITAPKWKETGERQPFRNAPRAQTYLNPQTSLLCEMLDLEHPNAYFCGQSTSTPLIDRYARTPKIGTPAAASTPGLAMTPGNFANSTFNVSRLSMSTLDSPLPSETGNKSLGDPSMIDIGESDDDEEREEMSKKEGEKPSGGVLSQPPGGGDSSQPPAGGGDTSKPPGGDTSQPGGGDTSDTPVGFRTITMSSRLKLNLPLPRQRIFDDGDSKKTDNVGELEGVNSDCGEGVKNTSTTKPGVNSDCGDGVKSTSTPESTNKDDSSTTHDQETSPVDLASKRKSDEPPIGTEAENSATIQATSESRTIKKFKRRNKSMYEDTETIN